MLQVIQSFELQRPLDDRYLDVACLRSFERARGHAFEEVDGARNARAQLLDRGLGVFEARWVLTREPRDGVLCDVAGDLNLTRERKHVGRQARAEQHRRVELAMRGARRGFLENER